MSDLADWLGLNYDSKFLAYYKHINMSHVMGDKGVSENPEMPSLEYYERRAKQAEQFESKNQSIKNNKSLFAVKRFVSHIDSNGLVDKLDRETYFKF